MPSQLSLIIATETEYHIIIRIDSQCKNIIYIYDVVSDYYRLMQVANAAIIIKSKVLTVLKGPKEDNPPHGGRYGHPINNVTDLTPPQSQPLRNCFRSQSIQAFLRTVAFIRCGSFWGSAENLRDCMKEFHKLKKLCSHSLQNILQHKPQVFGRQPGESMNSIEFYISCHIFKEILECVQYLHELNPPVIHRDLKPDNILVAKTVRNGRYLKVADFGLATVHQHSSGKGDLKYQAPEVGQGVVYNHKIDV
ncbi:unnamed protein product [Oppiella nova]|uniref:non-specific serine/threonine protein kinase n=1 Tax=Oppiella nova TaxID=334625 RepID=A0A7R9QIZ7_9ACAR|nr:unnamed protein product [Oppiella nova]CAG2166785.1 unnamed protein product [Oppiella nova]